MKSGTFTPVSIWVSKIVSYIQGMTQAHGI